MLVEAVHAVASGRKYLSPDIAQRLALRDFEVTQVRGLSEREFEVLRLLARGRTVREIAESMVRGSVTSPARTPVPALCTDSTVHSRGGTVRRIAALM